jgi:hypothetical protein
MSEARTALVIESGGSVWQPSNANNRITHESRIAPRTEFGELRSYSVRLGAQLAVIVGEKINGFS